MQGLSLKAVGLSEVSAHGVLNGGMLLGRTLPRNLVSDGGF